MGSKNIRVLFVCTGNTCRSPMAEYYFNNIADGMTAESCGLYAESGCSMSANARKVLENHNIVKDVCEISHKSREIDENIIKNADFIYGITEHHEARLKEDFPYFADKIFCMPENIGDPYGGNLEIYENCFENIKKSVDIIIKNLTERGS